MGPSLIESVLKRCIEASRRTSAIAFAAHLVRVIVGLDLAAHNVFTAALSQLRFIDGAGNESMISEA